MKKLIALILLLSMIVCLSACGTKEKDTETNESTQVETSTDETNNQTQQNDESAESNVSTVKETWTKDFYVDDFNEPTDEWVVYSSFDGTFSNSATNDSRLSGQVLIDAQYVAFILYEYNRNQVKNIYSDAEEYTIITRTNDAEQTFKGYIYSEGDRIIVDENNTESIKNLLKTGGEIKFYIYETDNSVTNYLFKVASNNLSDLLA